MNQSTFNLKTADIFTSNFYKRKARKITSNAKCFLKVHLLRLVYSTWCRLLTLLLVTRQFLNCFQNIDINVRRTLISLFHITDCRIFGCYLNGECGVYYGQTGTILQTVSVRDHPT